MKNIIIINQPLSNRGDEAAHKGLVRTILKSLPNAQIRLFIVGEQQANLNEFDVHDSRVIYENVPCSRAYLKKLRFAFLLQIPWIVKTNPTLRCLIQRIKESDLVMCAPGGICMGGFHNWGHVLFLKLAKYYNKPIAYYGRSIGPFEGTKWNDKLFNKWSYELLHYFGYISLRDRVSIKIAEESGLRPIETTDCAFLDSPKVAIPQEIKQLLGGKKYMVFVPNELRWHYKYKDVEPELIAQFYQGIFDAILSQDAEMNIIMLPQTFKDAINDADYFKKLVKTYKGDTNRIFPLGEEYSSDIQQTVIADAEYVIGSRYHSIVFAINNNRPFVSLSYEHKMSGLLQTIGAVDSLVDITSIFTDAQSITDATKQIAKTIDQITVSPVNPDVQNKAKGIAQKGYNVFLNYIEKQNF